MKRRVSSLREQRTHRQYRASRFPPLRPNQPKVVLPFHAPRGIAMIVAVGFMIIVFGIVLLATVF